MDTEKSGHKAKTKAPSLRLRCEEWEPFDANIPSTSPIQVADLAMLLRGIVLLLRSCRSPIRIHRPLLSCPRLVRGRSFLPVRPWVVAGWSLYLVGCIVVGWRLFPVLCIAAGWHLFPVTWLIVSRIEASPFEVSGLRASRLRICSFLVSYSCVIVPGIAAGIVPRVVIPGIVA